MTRKEHIDLLTKHIRALWSEEMERRKRRHGLEKQLNELKDQEAMERASKGREND